MDEVEQRSRRFHQRELQERRLHSLMSCDCGHRKHIPVHLLPAILIRASMYQSCTCRIQMRMVKTK